MLSEEQILKMNANALQCLQRGEYKAAALQLKLALSNLRILVNQFENLEPAASAKENHEAQVQNHVAASAKLTTISLPELPAYHHNIFTFFNRAFTISTCDQATLIERVSSVENKKQMSAALIYNMGVLHHSKAVRSGKSAEFNKALRLYNIAFEMVRNILSRSYTNQGGSVLILLMALKNNMGHIQSHFFNIQEAWDNFTLLQDIIKLVESEISISIEDDFVFFALNVLTTPHSLLTYAPAA